MTNYIVCVERLVINNNVFSEDEILSYEVISKLNRTPESLVKDGYIVALNTVVNEKKIEKNSTKIKLVPFDELKKKNKDQINDYAAKLGYTEEISTSDTKPKMLDKIKKLLYSNEK